MSSKLKKEIKRLNSILASNDNEKALNAVNKLLKDYPHNSYLVKMKSLILSKLEKYEELLKLYDNYSEDIYKNINLVHSELDALKKLEDIKGEAIFLNKSLIYHPDDFHLLNENENIFSNFQSTNNDLEFLKELLKVNPDNIEIYMNLAHVSTNLGLYFDDPSKHQDAIKYFDKAIELCKSDSNYGNDPSYIYITKGESLAMSKNYDEAIKTLDLIGDKDDNADVKFREKSIIYRKLGDYDNALKYIDKAIEIDSEPYLMETKGIIYLCMKDYDLAMEYFNHAIDNGWKSYYYKALVLKEKGEYSESISYLNKIKENEYLAKKGWVDHEYERAQKLIKEINLNN
ncbi:MAG: hypothetical protein LBT10_02320 [Methanobrevibacter sp.]|jgi:tetratricopeptide (TPR) repeat protein|nr:hypothetical protein [Methanobrevibacter sp.]